MNGGCGLFLRSGSTASLSVTAAEVDNKCVIEKDFWALRGRATSREALSEITVRRGKRTGQRLNHTLN